MKIHQICQKSGQKNHTQIFIICDLILILRVFKDIYEMELLEIKWWWKIGESQKKLTLEG